MQEGAGEESPPLATDSDSDRPHSPVASNLVDPTDVVKKEQRKVDTDESIGHRRLGDVLTPGDRCRSDGLTCRAGHTSTALKADRSSHHAFRAHRTSAPGATDVADAIRVPVAHRRLGP